MENAEKIVENMFKMAVNRFSNFEVPKELFNSVIHGFPLEDVKPSIKQLKKENSILRLKMDKGKEEENFSQINKILLVSSKVDKTNFYQS